jgi:hypothetical protein
VSFSAWGDESGSRSRTDPGVYMIAAAIGETSEVDQLRAAMVDLKLSSSGPKLHWADESAPRRTLVAETIARLPVEGFVVVRASSESDRIERRRRKCLEHLLHELTALGCDELVLESRGRADDKRDRQLLDRLRRSRRLQSELHMTHIGGPADPVLWIADALCGVVVQERTGDPSYMKIIESRLTIEVIEA